MKIKSKDDLIGYINERNSVKYILFWGNTASQEEISKACFSQWYPSSFKFENEIYATAEHFMMAEKARLFKDSDNLKKILSADNPSEAKSAGRIVKNFDESTWAENRINIVIKASYLKFSQNEKLKQFLLNTGEKILVEASPVDKIWGIGLAQEEPQCTNPCLWKGLNLLGFALMQARELIHIDQQSLNYQTK